MQDPKVSTPTIGRADPAFPKRFYSSVTVAPEEGGFALRLDGRVARTPAKNVIALPTAAAAQAVADEWQAVGSTIDPRAMPMTRLVNSVIDGVARMPDAVLAEIIRYAGSDLLVYRADSPLELVQAQGAVWDPVLAWSRAVLGADLVLGHGVMFVPQPQHAIDRIATASETLVGRDEAGPFRLGALHVMTTLTGSALLALAVLSRHLTAAEAWSAAHVDEDFQISQWGDDAEASERRAKRWVDMESAARLERLMGDGNASRIEIFTSRVISE